MGASGGGSGRGRQRPGPPHFSVEVSSPRPTVEWRLGRGGIVPRGLRGRVGEGWGRGGCVYGGGVSELPGDLPKTRVGARGPLGVGALLGSRSPLHPTSHLGPPLSLRVEGRTPSPPCPHLYPTCGGGGRRRASSAGCCVCVCAFCVFLSALQLCLTQLHSEGALHAAHCGVILGLALLGFIIFCVCKEMHHHPGDHQAEVGGYLMWFRTWGPEGGGGCNRGRLWPPAASSLGLPHAACPVSWGFRGPHALFAGGAPGGL